MWRAVFVLSFFACASRAQDATATEAQERVRLVRVAIEAKLKVGDVLREQGKLDEALKAYREAIALFETQAVVSKKPSKGIAKAEDPAPKPYEGRLMTRGDAKKAVDRALAWLAEHQSADGRWDCDEWMQNDPVDARTDGAGGALYDVGVTALSLLAFLDLGYGDTNNPYAANVANGIKFLIAQQDKDGCIGGRASQHYIYNAILATAALSDALRVTRNPRYRVPAQRAVDFLARARNPYLGWRYGVRPGENDTSVTALAVIALSQARLAGLQVDPDYVSGARLWIDKMTDEAFGQVGYVVRGSASARPEGLQDKFSAHKTQSMTAAGVLTRLMLGEDPRRSEIIQKGALLCARVQPAWDHRGHIDMYYWYLGTRALFEVGGAHWRDWPSNLWNALAANQHANGSWDPAGVWGGDGGRVYSTALGALTLNASLKPEQTRIFGPEK